jgi:hypothetical protein
VLVKVLNPGQIVIRLDDALVAQLSQLFHIAKGKVVLMQVQIAAVSLLGGEFFVTKIDNFIHDLIEHLICIDGTFLLVN